MTLKTPMSSVKRAEISGIVCPIVIGPADRVPETNTGALLSCDVVGCTQKFGKEPHSDKLPAASPN